MFRFLQFLILFAFVNVENFAELNIIFYVLWAFA